MILSLWLLGYFGSSTWDWAALANKIANLKHDARRDRKSFWTALFTNLGLGWASGDPLLGNFLFGQVIKMPADLRPISGCDPALAGAPGALTTVSSIFTNALKGRSTFRRVICWACCWPCCSRSSAGRRHWQGPQLAGMIRSLVFVRLAIAAPHSWPAGSFALSGTLCSIARLPGTAALRRLGYGTNVISPILTTLDRLIIGALIGVQSLTYYSIAQNFVVQTSILRPAWRSLFPRQCRVGETQDVSRKAILALVGREYAADGGALVLLEPFAGSGTRRRRPMRPSGRSS
jgi:hypothetical protein